MKRRYSIRAELIENKGVHFRVWAPDHEKVDIILLSKKNGNTRHPMKKEPKGYHSLLVPKLKDGELYYCELSGNGKWLADPVSRFQPKGPFGPSEVVDAKFNWKDKNWPGCRIENQIIYEMHIGTFTQEGTFKAAQKQLKELAKLGITLLEIMPINELPGHFGWAKLHFNDNR